MLNPLIQSILNFNAYSFSTDPADFELNESEIEQAFDRDIQEVLYYFLINMEGGLKNVCLKNLLIKSTFIVNLYENYLSH